MKNQTKPSKETLEKRAKWGQRFGNITLASIVTSWVTPAPVEQIASTVAVVGAIGYLYLNAADKKYKQSLEQDKENFVREHGADKNVRKYEELQTREKKIRRNRSFVFVGGVVAAVTGAVTATYLGQQDISRGVVFVGICVGGFASALVSRKELNSITEQKTSLVTALENRRSQMETAQTATAPKMQTNI
jgi:ABC-type uncharacterized transport system permease subunit